MQASEIKTRLFRPLSVNDRGAVTGTKNETRLSVQSRVWSADCGSPQRHGYATWREMFIERPRLLFGGCYIGKTTYVRAGENSFQDPNFQPWHLVTYFRYLRFFPEGKGDAPQTI